MLPSCHHAGLSPDVLSSDNASLPSPSSMNDPHPQHYLTTPCDFLHSTLLSEMFLNLCIVCFPNQNTSPRSAGTLPICLSLLALSSEVEQCWPQNCLGKESQGHPSWSSSPASSSRPFSTLHLQPSFNEPCSCLKCFLSGSQQSSRPNRLWPQSLSGLRDCPLP